MEHKKGNHLNHMWIMILACGGAFLLILILPPLGISKGWSSGIAVAVMIGLHLLMMRGHSGQGNHSEHNSKKQKGGSCH